jgi:hypothetical protein
MARSVVKQLPPDSEWRIKVTDDQGRAIYGLRIVAEALV